VRFPAKLRSLASAIQFGFLCNVEDFASWHIDIVNPSGSPGSTCLRIMMLTLHVLVSINTPYFPTKTSRSFR